MFLVTENTPRVSPGKKRNFWLEKMSSWLIEEELAQSSSESCNDSVVDIYNAANSIARFLNKNYFSLMYHPE
jgi:hypothetical protein